MYLCLLLGMESCTWKWTYDDILSQKRTPATHQNQTLFMKPFSYENKSSSKCLIFWWWSPTLSIPFILGLLWFQLHGPQICWSSSHISQWGTNCLSLCLLPVQDVDSTVFALQIKISNSFSLSYRDLGEFFSKVRVISLPPHQGYDMAKWPPARCHTPVAGSAAENKQTDDQGFLHPSSSPASSWFFFVKEDGSLRLCIDYRGLNLITVKEPTFSHQHHCGLSFSCHHLHSTDTEECH